MCLSLSLATALIYGCVLGAAHATLTNGTWSAPFLDTYCNDSNIVKDLGINIPLANCQAACEAEPNCHFITWAAQSNHACYLFGSCGNPWCRPGVANWWTAYALQPPSSKPWTPACKHSPYSEIDCALRKLGMNVAARNLNNDKEKLALVSAGLLYSDCSNQTFVPGAAKKGSAHFTLHDASQVFVSGLHGADTNAGTAQSPFKTIGRAQNKIRQIKQAEANARGSIAITVLPITVLIEGGTTYYEDLMFSPADSGSAGAPITYMQWTPTAEAATSDSSTSQFRSAQSVPVISGAVRLPCEGKWEWESPSSLDSLSGSAVQVAICTFTASANEPEPLAEPLAELEPAADLTIGSKFVRDAMLTSPWRSLLLNGSRVWPARYPNGDPNKPRGDPQSGYASAGAGSCASTSQKFKPNEKFNTQIVHAETGKVLTQGTTMPLTTTNRTVLVYGDEPWFDSTHDAGEGVCSTPSRRGLCAYMNWQAFVNGSNSCYNTSFNLPFWQACTCGCRNFSTGALHHRPAAWAKPSIATIKMFHSVGWGSWAFDVADYDNLSSSFRMSSGGQQTGQSGRCGINGNDYYVENVEEELDSPGEYFVRVAGGASAGAAASDITLRLVPPSGMTLDQLNSLPVELPVHPRVVQFRGATVTSTLDGKVRINRSQLQSLAQDLYNY
jgi:hypothetical protein